MMKPKYNPVKWSGSKKSQAKDIVNYFPDEISTYYEPFVGSASVLYELMHSKKKVDNFVASDVCKPLIDIYHSIQNEPKKLIDSYADRWTSLQLLGGEFYYHIRNQFNKNPNAYDFLFLTRTCTNGLIRFNKKGEFNNSFHFSRGGIQPEKLEKVILYWAEMIKNVTFIHCDYSEILPDKSDFIYLDPPYVGSAGMYYGDINYNELWQWLRTRNSSFALSFPGMHDDKKNIYEIPKDIYQKHEYINSGISSFRRLKNKGSVVVQESLYINLKK